MLLGVSCHARDRSRLPTTLNFRLADKRWHLVRLADRIGLPGPRLGRRLRWWLLLVAHRRALSLQLRAA